MRKNAEQNREVARCLKKMIQPELLHINKQLAFALSSETNKDSKSIKPIREHIDNKNNFSSKPKNIEKIINILAYADIVNFFIPVGFRYNAKKNIDIKELDPEYLLYLKLKEKLISIDRLDITYKLLFMYADDYATLNGVNNDKNQEYYNSTKQTIKKIFGDYNYDCFLSSEISNNLSYSGNYEMLFKEIKDNIGSDKWNILLKQSKRMNIGATIEETKQRAAIYANKRIEEASYMQSMVPNLIKISPVAPSLNDKVDLNMPTLYWFDTNEEAPRMKITN